MRGAGCGGATRTRAARQAPRRGPAPLAIERGEASVADAEELPSSPLRVRPGEAPQQPAEAAHGAVRGRRRAPRALLVRALDLLCRGAALESFRLLPGHQVDEATGLRDRLPAPELAQRARAARERLVAIAEGRPARGGGGRIGRVDSAAPLAEGRPRCPPSTVARDRLRLDLREPGRRQVGAALRRRSMRTRRVVRRAFDELRSRARGMRLQRGFSAPRLLPSHPASGGQSPRADTPPERVVSVVPADRCMPTVLGGLAPNPCPGDL